MRIQQAKQFELNAVKKAMKQWFLFLFSRSFFKSLVRLGAVWLFMIGGLWFYLKFYSRPGAIQDLPNLKGITLNEVQKKLDSLGLETIHLDSIYSLPKNIYQ